MVHVAVSRALDRINSFAKLHSSQVWNEKKIELVDLIDGKSTSSIIERIKKISCQ